MSGQMIKRSTSYCSVYCRFSKECNGSRSWRYNIRYYSTNNQWNNKVREANDSLACMCWNDNISIIAHSGLIYPRENLNNSKLHLNVKGSNKLRDNFVIYLKGLSSCESDTQSYSEVIHDKSIIGEAPPVARDENIRFSDSFDNIFLSECLSNLRQRNLNRLLLAHININFRRSKFD